MSFTFTANGKIAVKPIDLKGLQINVNKGFGRIEQKTSLVTLEVLFLNVNLGMITRSSEPAVIVGPGDKVLMRGDTYANYAANEYELDGVKYVLIDSSQVQLVQRHE